jgi:hypothetical protein
MIHRRSECKARVEPLNLINLKTSMKNKPQMLAGIGGLIGAALAFIAALCRYDFSVTEQMQEGVGYVVGGFITGAIAGFFAGKACHYLLI